MSATYPSHYAPPRIGLVAGQDPTPVVALSEAKDHLRIADTAEDDTIAAYVLAATAWAESRTHRAILKRQYTLSMSRLPPWGTIALPLGYCQSVDQIDYVDTAGNSQTLSAAVYQADLTSNMGARIMEADGQSWPAISDAVFNPVTVTFTAGWAPDEAPEEIRQAIKLKTGELYRMRGDDSPAGLNGAAALLAPWELPIWPVLQ